MSLVTSFNARIRNFIASKKKISRRGETFSNALIFFCTIVVPYLALRKHMTPWSKSERERFSFWEERSVKQLGHSRWCITFFWKSSWQRICEFSDKVYFLSCQQIRRNHGSITNFTKCKIIKSNCQGKFSIADTSGSSK